MQIKRLEIKNCLGIKELELEAGKINLVKGANEAGKTSVLESIERALRNTDRRVNFVHSGADEGTLYVELDNGLHIDRCIKENGRSSVKLTRGGEKVPKPETFLRSIAGEYAFNPVDFLARKDKEQAEILLSLIPMEITEEQLQEWFGTVPRVNLEQHPIQLLTYLAEKYFYDMRTIVNSEVKETLSEINALYEQLPDNYQAADWRVVNIGVLWGKVQEAQKKNANRERASEISTNYPAHRTEIENRYKLNIQSHREYQQTKVEGLKQHEAEMKQGLDEKISSIEEEIRKMQEQINRLQTEKKTLGEKVQLQLKSLESEAELKIQATEKEKEKELENLDKRVAKAEAYLQEDTYQETEPLVEKAQKAESMKGYIPLYDNMMRLKEQTKEKEEKAAWLDGCVKKARELPAQLLTKTELPVKGLDINQEMQLTIDNLPIRNLSTGRQIKLALDIARATAGPLKLICIDRFESLDLNNQEKLFQEIQNDGYQYFISTTQLNNSDNGANDAAKGGLTITTLEDGGKNNDIKIS